MLLIILAQLKNSQFSEYFLVVDSPSVLFSKRGSSDIIQQNSCWLESQSLQSLNQSQKATGFKSL